MNRSILTSLAALAALAPVSLAQAQSHSHAGMSAQDHAAMLAVAPTTFSATFPHAMTLTSLRLTGPDARSIDVAVVDDAAPVTTVSAPLPILAPGSYSAAWAAKGADGHQMNCLVRFMVH
jgi:methionine-rich copper-binding protein CopC